MASTIHVQMISDPGLLDVVDDYWREDHLPDDGKASSRGTQQGAAQVSIAFIASEANAWLLQIYHCLKGSKSLERKQARKKKPNRSPAKLRSGKSLAYTL